jgi:hypothetical protein
MSGTQAIQVLVRLTPFSKTGRPELESDQSQIPVHGGVWHRTLNLSLPAWVKPSPGYLTEKYS